MKYVLERILKTNARKLWNTFLKKSLKEKKMLDYANTEGCTICKCIICENNKIKGEAWKYTGRVLCILLKLS